MTSAEDTFRVGDRVAATDGSGRTGRVEGFNPHPGYVVVRLDGGGWVLSHMSIWRRVGA